MKNNAVTGRLEVKRLSQNLEEAREIVAHPRLVQQRILTMTAEITWNTLFLTPSSSSSR